MGFSRALSKATLGLCLPPADGRAVQILFPQSQQESPEPKFGAFLLVRMKGFEPTLF
jgi:hypothetical protein